jgi:hypothetical protein
MWFLHLCVTLCILCAPLWLKKRQIYHKSHKGFHKGEHWHLSKMLTKIVFWILFLISYNGNCQNEFDQAVQIKIEELYESSSNETDLSDLNDKIDEFRDHPINLNKTTVNELRRIPFLSEKQITNLLSYKETYGELYSVNELQTIDGFDSATIQQIVPFITILNVESRHSIRFRDIFSKGHCQFLLRYQQVLQKQQGYSIPDSILQINPNTGYNGGPQKYYFRLKYDYVERISIGFTGEKDPGEEFFKGSQRYGMDFYSGYIALKNTGILKNLSVGNFNADFGQGLTLCSSLSFGALPSSGNLRRFAGGIRPSLSTNENSYLRGIAATFMIRKISASFFYSRHKRDANIIRLDSISGEAEQVSSFQESGYHRLPNEIADKNAIREVIYGGNISFRTNLFTVGLTGFHSGWNATYFPVTEPYNRYAFSGRSNLNLGMDFQFIFRTIYGFGEISRSLNGGMAWLAGIQVNPDPNIKFSLICRDYQRAYQNLLSNAIGQNDKNTNEKGLILNFAARLGSKIGIYTYIDVYKFPWLKYRADFISYGSELSGQVDFSLSKSTDMFLRYRIKYGQVNASSDYAIKKWIQVRTESLRYQTNWNINPKVSLNNRFELVKTSDEQKEPEYGYVIAQDLSFKPQKEPVSLYIRYALFSTSSYETRIYTYENDVLFGYSVPALEGTGIRLYLMFSYKPWRYFEAWIRYAQTFYTDRKVIGTGLETINGDLKSEIKMQVLFRI